MFTVCPKCTKQFRLYAEHIAAASGQVRCGFCNTQFNALEHLHDKPLTNEKISNSLQPEPVFDISEDDGAGIDELDDGLLYTNEDNSEQVLAVEPEFDVPEQDEPEIIVPDNGLLNTLDESNNDQIRAVDSQVIISEIDKSQESQSDQDLIITNNEENTDQELDTAINEIGVDESDEDNGFEIETDAIDDNTPESIEAYASEVHYDFPDADELLSEAPIKRNWVSTLFWTSASFIGLIVITLQLSWFNRDLILMKYPQLTPYVKQVCKELNCRIIRQRDARAITLVNRDVRLHPTYQDTLLVNATMNNELAVRQPYPRVQLTLFDTSGALLGHRDFNPSDYLDDSIDLDEGMPVKIPVHFVLEVSGPTAGAVSFEFRFL
jgi:predicted Zn finger-like uncharacterized protein